MKQRPEYTIDALILSAAWHSDFGITKARLAKDLVLTYSKVNESCDHLMQKSLLEYDSVTRTYHITPPGREMIRLTEELADHYSPVEQMLSKYKSRVETGIREAREQSRQKLKDTYETGKEKLGLVAASPLLFVEQSLVHLDECVVQVLPC